MDNCPGEKCAVGADCPTDQVCDIRDPDTSKKCALCAEGSQPNEAKSKCEGTYVLLFIFQQTWKITIIPLNGLGKPCAEGTECPAFHVCDESKKCASCGEYKKPNGIQSKCESMFYHLFFNSHPRYFNTNLNGLGIVHKVCQHFFSYFWHPFPHVRQTLSAFQ